MEYVKQIVIQTRLLLDHSIIGVSFLLNSYLKYIYTRLFKVLERLVEIL